MIRTYPVPFCPVCQSDGKSLYDGLTDKLYGAPGTWSVSACTNKDCGALWLNPSPKPEDTGILYQTYSTHHDYTPANNKPAGIRKNLLNKVRSAVLTQELGYPTKLSSLSSRVLNLLSFLHPTWRDTQIANAFYLPYKKDGNLLDVGCGNGSSMLMLQNLGWQVTGIDFDEAAVTAAKKKSLDVRVGGLSDQNFPKESFDAILMNHVIEHLHDPISALSQCRELLKPGGVLVALTPNSQSRGHLRFGKYWRGLEIPRHIQVFSPLALEKAAKRAGFSKAKGRTSSQGLLYIYDASRAMENSGSFEIAQGNLFLNQVRSFWYGILLWVKPKKEEVAVLICRR